MSQEVTHEQKGMCLKVMWCLWRWYELGQCLIFPMQMYRLHWFAWGLLGKICDVENRVGLETGFRVPMCGGFRWALSTFRIGLNFLMYYNGLFTHQFISWKTSSDLCLEQLDLRNYRSFWTTKVPFLHSLSQVSWLWCIFRSKLSVMLLF